MEHSGFAFDSNQMEFEILLSKIVKRTVLENIPREFKRKIDLLDERQYKEKRTMLTGRQIRCQIFSFFDINNIQGRAMSVADMPNIEL